MWNPTLWAAILCASLSFPWSSALRDQQPMRRKLLDGLPILRRMSAMITEKPYGKHVSDHKQISHVNATSLQSLEHPEFLDEDMKATLNLPDELTTIAMRLEEEHAYREETFKKKSQVVAEYMDRLQVRQAYENQVQVMRMAQRNLARAARTKDGHLTRGIVIPAAGALLLNMTWGSIKVLRELLNCTLPIEIIYDGQREMDPTLAAQFEESFKDVRCVDSSVLPRPGRTSGRKVVHNKGWQHNNPLGFVQKMFALCYAASFDEVLLLDGDNLPLRNPEELFDLPEYKSNGNLFWPDLWSATLGFRENFMSPVAYTLFGLRPPWEGDPDGFASIESGQLLLNRVQHVDVLEWIWFISTHHKVMYKMWWGDTMGLLLAFHLANKSQQFRQVKLRPGVGLTGSKEGNYRCTGLLQFDTHGRPTFLHRAGDSKLSFFRDFQRLEYFTVPLTPRLGKMSLSNDIPGGGFQRHQIDWQRHKDCTLTLKGAELQEVCSFMSHHGELPITAFPVQSFPDVAEIVHQSERIMHSVYRKGPQAESGL